MLDPTRLPLSLGFILSVLGAFGNAVASPPPLHISAFKDITAFLLDRVSQDYGLKLEINYVKNADEAHEDLRQQRADIVFMSYDDTLSMAVQEGYSDIAAFLPVHGGLLDLCGTLDLAAGKNRLGIDTETGYARALRLFLRDRYPDQRDYGQLQWLKKGATNIRYERLLDGTLDATLLNPPYSYQQGVQRIAPLSHSRAIPHYLGVVGNLKRSWLVNPANRQAVAEFVKAYSLTVANLRKHRKAAVLRLAAFYHLPEPTAAAVYARLWEADGLATSLEFDIQALAETELIFSQDTGLQVPKERAWILPQNPALDRLSIPGH